MRGPSPVAASGGHSSSRCAGLSLSRPPPLRSTGSRRAGSVVVAHGPSRSAACGIFPDQGSNPCPLHWQADSQPLRHQGSPECYIFKTEFLRFIYLLLGVCRKTTDASHLRYLKFQKMSFSDMCKNGIASVSMVLYNPKNGKECKVSTSSKVFPP